MCVSSKKSAELKRKKRGRVGDVLFLLSFSLSSRPLVSFLAGSPFAWAFSSSCSLILPPNTADRITGSERQGDLTHTHTQKPEHPLRTTYISVRACVLCSNNFQAECV